MSSHPDSLVNAVHPVLEMLESRRLLCLAYEVDEPASTDVPPGYAAPDGGGADIIWVNRGQASDGFSVFGAQAETARQVIDEVIFAFERMIGDFNYSNGSNNFNLTVATSGNHTGASAALTGTLNGKAKAGTITMGRG